jgi:predicted N-acetyltransferase YhbS
LLHPLLAGGVVVSIRKATAEDTSGILASLSAAFDEYRDSYTSGAFADTVLTAESIAGRLQEMIVFVATDKSGEIVGTIACGIVGAEEGHIRGMAVLPAWQGTGIAARSLRQTESHFREANCKRISLDTSAPLNPALREIRLCSVGEDPRILWHAAHGIRQNNLVLVSAIRVLLGLRFGEAAPRTPRCRQSI